jgi:hypothetical protein
LVEVLLFIEAFSTIFFEPIRRVFGAALDCSEVGDGVLSFHSG